MNLGESVCVLQGGLGEDEAGEDRTRRKKEASQLGALMVYEEGLPWVWCHGEIIRPLLRGGQASTVG